MLICLVLWRTANCLVSGYVDCWQKDISIIFSLFCSQLVIVLEQLIIVWIINLVIWIPYSTLISERVECPWCWVWCWSEFVLTRHKFLEYLSHRRDILHHIIRRHFKCFNFTWVKLSNYFALILQVFKYCCLFIQHILCFIFHPCTSHYFSIVTLSCLLTGPYLPKLIRFNCTLPVLLHSFD